MSGLETLPPDQRAVMQLILVQGRGYADLAATLRLDAAAVRERAHAGAGALGLPGRDDVDADTRGRIVDYLLGQQDDGERIVTFAELGASPAACRWAQELRAQLAGIASEELPEVPASATAAVTNGSGASTTPVVVPTAAAVATAPAPTPAAAAAAVPSAPAPAAPRVAPPSPPATGGPSAPAGGPSGPRPSRLGGAILIGGAAVLAIVLAIVLIGGDDSPSSSGSTNGTQAQTSAQTQTSTSAASRQAAARTVGGAVLRAMSSGGSAFGAALVQQTANGRRLLAVEVARLPGNGAQEIYAIWLQGAAGNKFLGFVPNQVRANGTFTVSSALPRSVDLSAYSTVLVTSEGTSAVPTTPGTAVVSGPLRVAG
ncbi:MAG TPA: hypothetical protein VGO48_17695 [Conexibacter sp.]|nr:hypothetical protein [Conexibacter sp.]